MSVETEKLKIQTEKEVVEQSKIKLNRDGYCLWKCRLFSGEMIVILNDQFKRLVPVPRGYPVHTQRELELLDQLPDKTCRLVHAAKKSGAVIESVEVRK